MAPREVWWGGHAARGTNGRSVVRRAWHVAPREVWWGGHATYRREDVQTGKEALPAGA